jgi:hypothetical protein
MLSMIQQPLRGAPARIVDLARRLQETYVPTEKLVQPHMEEIVC